MEPEGYSRLQLPDRSASGTKRFALCRGVRMMDGTGRREPLAHTKRLLMKVEIGPPTGPRTRRSCRQPYGICWTLLLSPCMSGYR